MNAELKKMKIEAFDSIRYESKTADYVVLFNPATYTQKYHVVYGENQGENATGSTKSFCRIKPQEYQFDFVFDGTGVASKVADVDHEIETFLTVTGKMGGDIHRPFFLKISWGSLLVHCVLQSADITYTLFKPNGFPLRAKVTAKFSEIIDDELRTALERKQSPDLTHQRIVKESDTLPLLSYEVYGDSRHYIKIAEFNHLVNFRRLKVGTSLVLPPLKELEKR